MIWSMNTQWKGWHCQVISSLSYKCTQVERLAKTETTLLLLKKYISQHIKACHLYKGVLHVCIQPSRVENFQERKIPESPKKQNLNLSCSDNNTESLKIRWHAGTPCKSSTSPSTRWSTAYCISLIRLTRPTMVHLNWTHADFTFLFLFPKQCSTITTCIAFTLH